MITLGKRDGGEKGPWFCQAVRVPRGASGLLQHGSRPAVRACVRVCVRLTALMLPAADGWRRIAALSSETVAAGSIDTSIVSVKVTWRRSRRRTARW